jgi:hypothetical protein
MNNLVERLRERAKLAREEMTGTALGDALHFEEAADEIEQLNRHAQRPLADRTDLEISDEWERRFGLTLDPAECVPAQRAPDREMLAKTIQQFWQGKHSMSRPWDGAENSCCVALPGQADWFRRLADHINSAATSTPNVPAQCRLDAVPPVERIEMVQFPNGYEIPAEPIWRVEVSGRCADFETETGANHFRDAILALSSLTSTHYQPIEKTGARASTYCAHCDHEHQLHEDARGFHHVIRGERVPCCSVTSTDRCEGK